jgi:exonuclease III
LTSDFRLRNRTRRLQRRVYRTENLQRRGDFGEPRNQRRAEKLSRRRGRRAETIDCRNRRNIRIVNTYIPNGTELWTDKFTFKLDWLQRLRKFFDATCLTDSDVLLCGDFNVAPDERDVWDERLWEGKLHFSKPNAPQSSRQAVGFYRCFSTNKRRREKIFVVELP